MPTNLISIGRSGAAAARAALEVSAQNIANASNPEYSRRRLLTGEATASATINYQSASQFGGVQINGIQRPGNNLLQRAVRDSGSDLSRVNAELSGLRDAELALEQSRLYEGLIGFEASLTLLESDPTDPALRTGAIESARQLAQNFHLAEAALGDARGLIEDDITVGLERINSAAEELTRINAELVKARDGSSAKAALLDARDAALREMSEEFSITASFDDRGVAEVRLVGSPLPPGEQGVLFVSGVNRSEIGATLPGDGTVAFTIGAASISAASGAMAGRANALADIASRADALDLIANETIARANQAQANGAALDGAPGQPLFTGSGAAGITLALDDGSDLALAPLGSAAGSRDTSNLGNLLAAIGADDGPINAADKLLLALSSRISGLATTREGLSIINESAQAELRSENGVDLDEEAASLIRLQQAFEANSRVIQVATDLFDTILGLR